MTIRFGAFDRSWRQVAVAPVDARVCDCCPTTAAVTSDGPIVAFRTRTEDEIRDIYVSRLEAGHWSEPVPVHRDGWKIVACPVNGPMLSARGHKVVVSWFTAVGDAGRAYVAFSNDAGRSFGAPVRLDDVSTLGRVDVELLADGSAVGTWIELGESEASFMVRRFIRSGFERLRCGLPHLRARAPAASRASPFMTINCSLPGPTPNRVKTPCAPQPLDSPGRLAADDQPSFLRHRDVRIGNPAGSSGGAFSSDFACTCTPCGGCARP